jgi:hypothetical protein
MPRYASEEELGSALRELLAAADPVPAASLAAASHTLAWRDPDAALAELTSDLTEDATVGSVRGTPPRLLTFTTGAVTIDLEVTAEGGRVRLLGQLVPTGPAGVVVEHPTGSTATTADELGRFAAEGLPPGWLRVVVDQPGPPPARSHTEWFTG